MITSEGEEEEEVLKRVTVQLSAGEHVVLERSGHMRTHTYKTYQVHT